MLKNNASKTILTIDGTPVSTEEFLYVYHKNNQKDKPASKQEIRDYLDLFINFKLKVKEAEAVGLHRDSTFIKELEGYRKQLASPYLTETKLLDSLARITYDRLKLEINASHILLKVDPDASPADTLSVYHRITELRNRVLAGEDFDELASKYSEDPSVKQNKGNLGYFTAMQMVYPFEQAAYNLPVGRISNPVRTQFGYHIIKVLDKRPSQGRIKVSHILVRAPDGISTNDSTSAANRAREIFYKARNHEDWNLLCRQFSEDIGTKMKGGTLPWFKTGDISNIPAFEKTAFGLQEIGQISEPVKTSYGWHIIRLDDKQDLEPFKQLEPKIQSILTANSRADLNQQELVKRLKTENRFREHRDVIEEAIGFANETLYKGTWQSLEHWGIQNKILFSIESTQFTVADFYRYVEENQPYTQSSDPSEVMMTAYHEFTTERLIAYEEKHLADKYYDYKMLLKEYRDGILLFQLMETKVWNRAVRDTVGLKRFFEEHQDQYQWKTRVDANIFNVIDRQALEEVRQFLDNGYFSYNKYDFYGSTNDLNKAQIKILSSISQTLSQNDERYLVMQFDTENPDNQKTQSAIITQLESINSSRLLVQPLMKGTLEFILFVASNSLKDLEENMNQKNPLTIQIESGRYQQGEHPVVDMVEWKEGTSLVEIDNRLALVEINEVIPRGDQELDEIKGQVISDYQAKLESEWVSELKNKYEVDIHEKELESVYEQYSY